MHHFYANQLAELCSPVKPFPVTAPKLVVVNKSLAKELKVNTLTASEQTLFQALFSERGELQKQSVAQKYGGHQFGQYNPFLGDGRGLLLGETYNRNNQLIDLHLKGAGPTPYSRHADGRAVLRSTIREYLASEALHYLNIPSSRALALITSKEPVLREQVEKGAMLIRTCPSHIRFGHFEYFYHAKEPEKLNALFEFCFEHHFMHLQNDENPYLSLLTEIAKNTAKMVAKWQAYGFNHGVMNTDNMSIHGITFDFGPYAFLDDFIPQYICNKSDHSGRYAFNQQPSIALWNLNALAHAFSDKLTIDQLKLALSHFEPEFLKVYQLTMSQRIGLSVFNADCDSDCNDSHKAIVQSLSTRFTKILADEFADYHQSFRLLSTSLVTLGEGNTKLFCEQFKQVDIMQAWVSDYIDAQTKLQKLTGKSTDQLSESMCKTNPKYVLRNHLMQQAIKQAQLDDFSLFNDLLKVICQPFDEHQTLHHLSIPPSENEKGIALSCSS